MSPRLKCQVVQTNIHMSTTYRIRLCHMLHVNTVAGSQHALARTSRSVHRVSFTARLNSGARLASPRQPHARPRYCSRSSTLRASCYASLGSRASVSARPASFSNPEMGLDGSMPGSHRRKGRRSAFFEYHVTLLPQPAINHAVHMASGLRSNRRYRPKHQPSQAATCALADLASFGAATIVSAHFLLRDHLDRGVGCTTSVHFLGKNCAEI